MNHASENGFTKRFKLWPVVSPSFLAKQEWELVDIDVKQFYDANFNFIHGSEWPPCQNLREKLSSSVNKGTRKLKSMHYSTLIILLIVLSLLLDLVPPIYFERRLDGCS